ncbi:MAG TPA: cytochrome c3 family protein, partial [Candidatus Eisenbacteria bacterium]|nr:cytochrome c3 family protein [Candidatus Eisenbacteria bacterium]
MSARVGVRFAAMGARLGVRAAVLAVAIAGAFAVGAAWAQPGDSTAAPAKAAPPTPAPAQAPPQAAPAAPRTAPAKEAPARAIPRAAVPPAATAARATAADAGVVFPPTPVSHEESKPPARAVPPGSKAGVASKMCGVCHSEVRVKYEQGVHKTEGIACTSCHGGDADALTVEGAHKGNFRGVPSRRSIPALCASCHADVAKMRVYNLPSNQYELYQTSQHGIRLAKGDEGVAVCTDCHGVHEIRPRDDPKSSVFGRNIPATCGKCHGNAAFLARRGKKD